MAVRHSGSRKQIIPPHENRLFFPALDGFDCGRICDLLLCDSRTLGVYFGHDSIRSKKNRILFFLTLFGTVAGVATIQLINRMGFLRTEKTAFELIKFSDWGKYICNTADTWFRIFGFLFANFSIRKPDAIFEISGAVTALIVFDSDSQSD